MPAARPTAESLLLRLSDRFDPSEVKQRTQGGKRLDFISIDTTIRRFNDVLGSDWNTENVSYSLHPIQTNSGGTTYCASVSLTLSALGKAAVGVGADVAPDADKALKTALAEAIKKAGHQFGVGLYLWDEEERDAIQVAREGGGYDPLVSLKNQVANAAIAQGADRNADSIAEFYGVSTGDLQDEGVLKRLLSTQIPATV